MQRPDPTRALLLAALLVFAAPLLAPPALAQKPQPTLELRAEDPLRILAPGESAVVALAARYVAAAPEPGGVRFAHALEGGAAWATLALDPEETTVPGNGQREVRTEFRVVVRVAENASGGALRLAVGTATDPTLVSDAASGAVEIVIEVRDNRSAAYGAQRSAPAGAADAAPPAPPSAEPSFGLAPSAWPDEPRDARAQSRHAQGFSGGETLGLLVFAGAGAYAGHRFRRRWS